jgi:hypothetical protein
MSAQRWKRQERAIALQLRSTRIPNSGAGQPDIRAAGWAIQVKTRRALPAWLWAAVDQAARDAGEGEQPAVVLAEVSQGKRARRLVVLDFDAWASDQLEEQPA